MLRPGTWLLPVLRDALGLPHPDRGPEAHLRAVIGWLSRAQDAAGGTGVARMFDLRTGWGAAYPETTGYIIPTFALHGRAFGDTECAQRARRMAEWEIEVRLPGGAVRGGTVADPPSPAVFNTGQVVFGWLAAFEAFGDRRFADAARDACHWLVGVQDPDGAWRRELSAFCTTEIPTYAYNVRTAWALARAGEVLEEPRFRDAALRNLRFTLGLVQPNGWIESNCLNRPETPLLHTIAYALRGLFEAGLLLGEKAALDAARRGSEALAARFEERGRLRGRYRRDWTPACRWRCLTGEAQIAVLWYRMAGVFEEPIWRERASRLNRGLRRRHATTGPPGRAGGLAGSYPIWAEYGRWQYLNWAAKFLADSLHCELGIPEAGVRG